MSAAPPLHVLEIVAAADHGAIARLADELERAGARVSVLCGDARDTPLAHRAAGRTVLQAALADDPSWATIRLAASWSVSENVDVFHAHGAAAHLVAVLAGALCEVPCVATIPGDEIPMLDLEAHRLGDRAHLCVEGAQAFHHARALGVAPARLHHAALGREPARVYDVLRACAQAQDALRNRRG